MKRTGTALLLAVCCAACGSAAQDDRDQYFPGGGDFAGSHILVAYQGAERAAPTVQRTRGEAEEKARGLIAKLREDPSVFEELARTESDGPSASAGGNLGFWNRGSMAPEFQEAIENLKVGQISSAPVATPFGFHIIRRNPNEVMHWGGDAFIIGYKGAPRMPASVGRSREEAKKLADSLTSQVTSQTFDELARQHNDMAEGPLFLGAFKQGDRVPPIVLETFKGLQYGQTAGPIELPFGYGFVRRQRLQRLSAAQILVAYQGAEGVREDIQRSKEEARAKAVEFIQELKASPERFADLAAQSDGPAAAYGGSMGVWFKGTMTPELESVIAGLPIGDIADEPVETPYGFHVIQRRPLP